MTTKDGNKIAACIMTDHVCWECTTCMYRRVIGPFGEDYCSYDGQELELVEEGEEK